MNRRPLFSLGKAVMTPGALGKMAEAGIFPLTLLARHQSGDWGDIHPDDRRVNDRALRNGGRILSAYSVNGTKLWVITEADRSSTCILLPDEY